jgi:hypothetical protein
VALNRALGLTCPFSLLGPADEVGLDHQNLLAHAGLGCPKHSPYRSVLLHARRMNGFSERSLRSRRLLRTSRYTPFSRRLADVFHAFRAELGLFAVVAAIASLLYLPAHAFWTVVLVSLFHAAVLAPLVPLRTCECALITLWISGEVRTWRTASLCSVARHPNDFSRALSPLPGFHKQADSEDGRFHTRLGADEGGASAHRSLHPHFCAFQLRPTAWLG